MLLEIATEERLVGKVHPVGDFLDVEMAVFELVLDLHDRMAVDDRLGALAAHGQGDVGEVARGDVERLRVEGDLPLGGAMAQYELQELLEQHLLAIDPFIVGLLKELAGAAIEMEEQVLYVVGCHLPTVGILSVVIDVFHQKERLLQQGLLRLVELHAGVLFDEAKEGWL